MGREFSKHQKKIIQRYYEHRDDIMLQKLQELIGEAYLADTPRKRDNIWKRIRTALANLEVPPRRIDQICDKQNPEVLAEAVQNMLGAEEE